MIDSVEKNLHIENDIAAALDTAHILLHLLCKAHTVEALDSTYINVLANLETSLNFRQALESINPGVKSFLLGEKSVALPAINSTLNFVSHDKSSSSTKKSALQKSSKRKAPATGKTSRKKARGKIDQAITVLYSLVEKLIILPKI